MTRTFNWTPGFAQAGSYTVTFTATDNGGLSASEAVVITVTNTNRVPTAAITGNTGTVSVGVAYTTLSGSTSSDPDGDALSLRLVVHEPPGRGSAAAFTGGTTVTPSFTPDRAGSYTVQLIVTDNNIAASSPVTATLTTTNRAPVLSAIGAKSVAENANLNFTVSATDPDGDPIAYGASPLPSGASFDNVTRTFNWTPGFAQAGIYTVTFTATDNGGLSGSEAVVITVTNTNRAPTANAGPITRRWWGR